MKYANYIIFALLLLSGFLLKEQIHISTNLLALFSSKQNIQNLHIASELGYSKEMFIAVKGFDKEAKNKLKRLAYELKKLKQIQSVKYTIKPSKSLQKYYKTHYMLLSDFDAQELNEAELKQELQTLYNKQFANTFYSPINKNDPLELFKMPKQASVAHKGKYLILKDYGYLMQIGTKVSPSQMKEAQLLYTQVNEILSKEQGVIGFAGFFYTVENSRAIKSDVKYIVALSTILLLLIYFVMLRDIKLLSQTFIALASSMIFAVLVCTTSIENFGVLSLAFGTSLTAVSIDYFFHYYFHGFYQEKKTFEKSVFYGFVTTIAAFGIFAFIPVAMISQISIFALLSLSFAYLIFTFVFPYLDIKPAKELRHKEQKTRLIPSLAIFALSLVLLFFSVSTLKFDANIKNLDYQNKKLQDAQALFATANTQKLTPVIVKARTQEELMKRLHTIKNLTQNSFSFANFVLTKEMCTARKKRLENYDFTRLNKLLNEEAKALGFKKNYFIDAYKFTQKLPQCTQVDLTQFQDANLHLYKKNDTLYTIAMVENTAKLSGLEYVSSIDVQAMFAKVAKQMYKDIVFYSSVVLLVIFVLLYVSVREKFFFALNYILFPLSFSLSVVVSFYPLNIMHLFSFIILIAIGIDYGIYMSKTNKPTNTVIAIKYSLLSTFAAFGVLLFSSISALYSIGIVISLGVGAIYFLTKVMR
jgi:predicted exporter